MCTVGLASEPRSSYFVIMQRCCVQPVRLISQQPAPFVLVHACMVLKPTPRCSRGAHHCEKWGEPAELWEGFRLNLQPSAFLRLLADPEPSQGLGGWESPCLELASRPPQTLLQPKAAGCATHSAGSSTARPSLRAAMEVQTSIFILYVNPHTIIQNYL